MAAVAAMAAVRVQAGAPRHRHLRPGAGHRVPGRARARRGQQGRAPARPGEPRLAGRGPGAGVREPVLLRPAHPGAAATGLVQPRPVPAVPHRPGRRGGGARHPGRDVGQCRDRLPPVHRRGHQGQRRRPDDGDQGPGLDRDAERSAVAVPGHLHPAGRLPPDLRDRGHRRRRGTARGRPPGPGRHPRGSARVPHPAHGRRPDTRPDRRRPGTGLPRGRGLAVHPGPRPACPGHDR